jgi:2-polyprenyl-3-methyl-5-hydroxy-6-metoxy-1,4-benzoquinol methylase
MPVHISLDINEDIDEDMRMSVPASTIAFPAEERDALPAFSGRKVVRMPLESLGEQAVEDLEALRAEGCEYLILPRTAFGWLEASPSLAAHLDEHYTRVVQTDSCAVFSLHRRHDFGGPYRVADDGLPLPPPYLIRITSGGHRQALGDMSELYRNFWRSGVKGFNAISELLERNGYDPARLGSVLDFGCGSGRILRHWHKLDGVRLYGADYNPLLISWCRANLDFADYEVTKMAPSLQHDDGELDLVYAFSVFSHFAIETQVGWMDELIRVVRPGGLVMITVPGERWIGMLSAEDRERFMAGEPVVMSPQHNGTNLCATLSPERYVRATLSRGIEVVDFAVDGAPDVRQDAVLLRKPDSQ